MAKNNGKGIGDAPLDVEHELPVDTENNDVAGINASGVPDEVARLKAENATYLDRLARLQAEFDNYRKRAQREQQDYREYALAEALKQFLPILDSLDRALKTEGATAENFRSGIELIDRQFHDALSRLGVEPLEAAGQPFDPTLHQAIQMVETDEVADNHVVDELQRGYRIKDRLLRPAMVRVANQKKS